MQVPSLFPPFPPVQNPKINIRKGAAKPHQQKTKRVRGGELRLNSRTTDHGQAKLNRSKLKTENASSLSVSSVPSFV
jgi:hypothetical protein